MIELNRDDPVQALIKTGTPTADIEEDENGYQRVYFTPDAQKQFEQYLDEEHTFAETDYKPVIDEALRCERIYEAMSDGEELLTLPIAKRDANQYIAEHVSRIWNKDPLFTCRPEEQRQFTMLDPSGPQVQLPDRAVGGQMMPGAMAPASRKITAWSDDIAENIERLVEHKLRKRVEFLPILTDVTTQMIKGVQPAWVKKAYEKRTRLVKQTRVDDLGAGWYVANGTEEVEVPFGDPHKLIFRNVTEMLLPADCMNEQEAPWLSEDLGGMDSTMLRHKISAKEYQVTDAELDELLKAAEDLSEIRRQRDYARIDRREAKQPRKLHDVRETWAYWPFVGEDGEISIYSLCCHWHRKAKKLLKAYINPNQHGMRPYVPFFQRKRPGRFSGGSLVQDAAPFQKVISVMMHLQLNNAAQANMVAFLVRQGSAAWKWLSKHKVGPGGMIAVNSANIDSEIKPFRLGTDFRSMGPEIDFLNNEDAKVTTISDADRDVPNRTAVGTVDRVQENRRQQSNLVLESARYSWAKVCKFLVQEMQQYDIYGESVPFQDPKTKAITMMALRLPIEAIADQFTFMLSASSEDDTKDQRFMRLAQAQKIVRDTRRETIANLGPMWSPQAPPAVRAALKHSIIAEESLAGEMLELVGVVNKDKYVFSEDAIEELDAQQQQWIQQKMEEMANNPPTPPPPTVSLSAKLTPEQEAQAAQRAGVGAAAQQQPQIGTQQIGPSRQIPQGNPVA